MKTPSEPVYVSNSGNVACRNHGGAYLSAHTDHRPDDDLIVTPLDVWQKLSTEDLAGLPAEDVSLFVCEAC